MCGAAWGSYQVDKPSTTVYLKCLKARDFEEPSSLYISGRPSLDETGRFAFISRTDDTLKAAKKRFGPKTPAGPKPDPERDAKLEQAVKLLAAGLNQREIAEKLEVSQQTVSKWLRKAVTTEVVPTT